MGLSIGVSSVYYLPEPSQPICDFMSDLRDHPSTGLQEYYGHLNDRHEDDPLWDYDDDIESNLLGAARLAQNFGDPFANLPRP